MYKLKESLRIGVGAGYSGDRIDPAEELAKSAELDYLIFECLAERTISLAQLRKLGDSGAGFDPLLDQRVRMVFPAALEKGTRIITNMGQANPTAAAKRTAEILGELGVSGVKVAALVGDDVLDTVARGTGTILELGESVEAYADRIVSANAYLGAQDIVQALEMDADVIITGRVADPSLFLAPMIYEFGWSSENYRLMGQGTVVGHLLECAGQLTGGYFADPVSKPVTGMASLGFPYAIVEPSGEAILTKLEESGGEITLHTCKEQLLYEIGDPARYLTPDVIADFTSVRLELLGQDTVRVSGGTGETRPDTLKVAIGFRDGFLGEGQISYAGPSASQRAHLAGEIIVERLNKVHSLRPLDLRVDYIGENSAFRNAVTPLEQPAEVRLRVAAKTRTRAEADLVGREVEALYTNGPAGGGGAHKHTEEIIGVVSMLLERSTIVPRFEVHES